MKHLLPISLDQHGGCPKRATNQLVGGEVGVLINERQIVYIAEMLLLVTCYDNKMA